MLKKLIRQRTTVTPTLEPHDADLEFALVLVEGGSNAQTQWTIGAVTEAALAASGEVLQILGPLIFVGFGVISPRTDSARMRAAFVQQLLKEQALLVKIIHGRSRALIGTFGCEQRKSFTAVPEEFSAVLGALLALKPGEAVERGA